MLYHKLMDGIPQQQPTEQKPNILEEFTEGIRQPFLPAALPALEAGSIRAPETQPAQVLPKAPPIPTAGLAVLLFPPQPPIPLPPPPHKFLARDILK